MADVKDLIERVAKESGSDMGEIEKRMNQRKEKTHGLLSDYGAVYAVAKELGIDLNQDKIELTEIAGLKPQKSVNIAGKVKVVYSPREFKRKDKTVGKFASLILLDNTGEVRLVLWDQNTEITKRAHIGDTLLIRNGYSKDNNGVLEVHASSLTNVAVNPSMELNLPEVEESLVKIADVKLENQAINLICRIVSYYPGQEFERNDGTKGARASFIGEDETGRIRVVLWDRSAGFPLQNGEYVKIENGYARQGLNNDVEVHIGSRSRIIETNKELNLPPLKTKVVQPKIAEIKLDMSSINVIGRVVTVYPPREYSKGTVASLIIGDETSIIRTVLWDDKAHDAGKIRVGDAVKLENVYSKANLNLEPELHVGKYGKILVDNKIDVPALSVVEEISTKTRKIADLDVNDKRVRVTGTIVDLDTEKPLIFMTCPGCGKKVQNLSTSWFCEMCGDVDPNLNMVASITVEDETGTVRAVLFGDNSEKLLNLTVDDAMNIIGERQDETAPLKGAKKNLLERQVSLVGRVKYNEFSDQLELIVDEVH
ncbi:MAG: OB-fold nucleic acid binding domain-containing protein [Candidatus Altiarchaeota archaeon]